jgi:methyl-accepting chemotaxis protein
MEASEQSATDLNSKIEDILELVSKFKIGRGYFEEIIAIVNRYKRQIEDLLTEYSNQGVNVFDRNYKPIEGTDPQKYSTQYDTKIERELQQIYDRMLSEVRGGVFCLAVDVNGYAPTHNGKYSQPLTGDKEKDTISSRDKRIFNDHTGLRAAKNTAPILLQAYARDTGEVLNDLSMPIMVEGKHWGGYRLGFDPSVLLENMD